MATQAQIAAFSQSMAPYAIDAGATLGVDPNEILGQWGLESNYGTSQQAQSSNNFGGLMSSSGAPLTFSSPADFTAAFIGYVQRMWPGAVNTGSNASAYVAGLSKQVQGPNGTTVTQSYFGINPNGQQETAASYLSELQAAEAAIAGAAPATTTSLSRYAGSGDAGLQQGANANNIAAGGVGGSTPPASVSWSKYAAIAADAGLLTFGLAIMLVAVAGGVFGQRMPVIKA
jgi:hypothetical protein